MVEGNCSTLEPYALRVLGDSMEPEFPDGCIVIVDPGYAPRDGAYVVVEYAGDVFLIGRGAAISIFVAIVLVLAGVQFAYLKCPHCGGSAIFTPNGVVTPWTGSSCRHCGREY